MKAKEKEMKDEKEAERQVRPALSVRQTNKQTSELDLLTRVTQRRVAQIKDKRAAKEEKERYEKLAAKMHKKRVERLKRKEKRNKLLNS